MKWKSIGLSLLLIISMVGGVAALAGSASAAPSGFVSVTDSQVYSDLPEQTPMGQHAQAIADAGVMSTKHADSLEVVVTSPGRAKNKIDGWEIHGSGPISIVITDDEHTEGRTVALPAAEVEDALGYQPEMARGTHDSGMPWNSEIEYQDGWMLVDVPHFSTNTVTFAGQVQIGDTFSDGSQVQYGVSDMDAASDVTVNLTGKVSRENESVSGQGNQSVSVGGNIAPSGSINGNPTLVTTGQSYTLSKSADFWTSDSSKFPFTKTYTNPPATVTSASVTAMPYADGDSVDVHLEVIDEATGNTYVGDTVTISGNRYDDTTASWDGASFSPSGDVTLKLVYDGGSGGIDGHDNTWDLDGGGATDVSYNIGGESVTVSSVGIGESATSEVNLPNGDLTLNTTIGTGSADWTLNFTERTQTQDPGVELNDGNWANHTGTLADGETVQYTINKSALQSGTNTINASLPSLSADAPPMQVQVEYVHDAQDDQTVEYEAEKFTERYNVSKTYSSDRTNPTLTIPFADEAVAIRQAEYRVNGGDWQTTTDWVVSNTTGTVHLPDAEANDTIDVRANASKVTVQNGEIKVLEPTPIGSNLDSKIEVTSAQGSEELVLGIGSSPDAHLAHTTYEESWTADPYGVISTDDHEFHLPDAAAGSVFRVKTTPMEISPRSNDVVYEVPDDSDSLEPKIELSPGSTSGDTVDLTFTDAADSQSYNLMSLTFGTVRDDGTASSPLTLTDDDSDEILQFQVEDDGGSTDDTSGTGFWQDQVSVQSVQEAAPVVDPRFIALLMLAIVGIAVFYTEEDDELDDKPVHQRKLVWFGVGMSFLFGLLFLDPRAFTGPLQNALDATLPIAGILGVIAILVSVVMWWRSRQAEAGSPDTVLQFNGKTIGGTDNPSEDDKGGGWL